MAIIIANARKVSGSFEFAPSAKIDDDKLELVIIHRLSVGDLVRIAWNSFVGKLQEDPAVTCLTGGVIEVKSDPPLDLQIDGESVEMPPPIRVEIHPGALRVAVPTQAQQTSFAESLRLLNPITQKQNHADQRQDKGFRKLNFLWLSAVALISVIAGRAILEAFSDPFRIP